MHESVRRYNWSFSELCDRISIVVQKIVYAENDQMRAEFVRERDDIIHDLDLYIKEGVQVDGRMVSHICTLQLINATIWSNESAFREGGSGTDLTLTHSLNCDRANVKAAISKKANGRIDYKLNYNKGLWDLNL